MSPVKLVMLAILVGIGFWMALVATIWAEDLPGLVLNLGTEIMGAVAIYLILDQFIGSRERREAAERELEEYKRDLIRRMGSKVHDVAIEAAEEARARGWLIDGSLAGAYLNGAALQEANLQGADLQGARMRDTDLREANLCRVHLQGADLQGANLPKADLQHAFLRGANLQSADLQGANLFAALGEVRLASTNLQGAFLFCAYLRGAVLSSANLQEANLAMTHLQGADFSLAGLQGANFLGAALQKANLQGADLQGAKLWAANERETFVVEAHFNETTTLPDGTKWRPNTEMARFTDPKHPEFWRSDDPESPAYEPKEQE